MRLHPHSFIYYAKKHTHTHTKCHDMPRYNLWRARKVATFLSKCACCTWIIGFVAVAWPKAAKSLCWLSLPEPVSQKHRRSPDCASNLFKAFQFFPLPAFQDYTSEDWHSNNETLCQAALTSSSWPTDTWRFSTCSYRGWGKTNELNFIPVGVFAQRRARVARAKFGKFKRQWNWHRPWYRKQMDEGTKSDSRRAVYSIGVAFRQRPRTF